MADVIRKATNRFTKGLVMDFSPENTRNELLTNALNATLLTFNGNELSLQNDMGNARVETAYLPEGYMPVGTCEYGGIIYIVSYNPLENKSQIGCFPSPERNVSSDELGKEGVKIESKFFQEFADKSPTGEITNMSYCAILRDDKLNPGDKFIITANSGIYDEALENLKIGDKIKNDPILTLNIVSIEDSGKITYLNSDVLRYDKTIGDKTYNYHILGSDGDQEQLKEDIDAYRSAVSSGYSVFKSKTSGRLAILAELVSIDSYSVTHSVNPSYDENNNVTAYKVELHHDVTPNNSDSPKLSYYCLSKSQGFLNTNEGIIEMFESDGKSEKFEAVKLKNIFVKTDPNDKSDLNKLLTEVATFDFQLPNKYYKAVIKDGDYQDVSLASITLPEIVTNNGIDLPFIYDYTITPCMSYGKLEHLAVSNTVDFSKLHDFNKSEFTTWKYLVEQDQVRLTFGADVYDTYESDKVDGILLEFYDNQGFVGSLLINDKKSYSGVYTKLLQLDSSNFLGNTKASKTQNSPEPVQEDGTSSRESGKLQSNLIYGVKTYLRRTVNEVEQYIQKSNFYLLTMPLLNEYYYSVDNFNNINKIDLDFLLTYKLEDSCDIEHYEGEGYTEGYNEKDYSILQEYRKGTLSVSDTEVTKIYQYSGTSKLKLEIGLEEKYSPMGFSYDATINNYFSCELKLSNNNDTGALQAYVNENPATSLELNIPNTLTQDIKFKNADNSGMLPIDNLENYMFINKPSNGYVEIKYDFFVGYKVSVSDISPTEIPTTTMCALCHQDEFGQYNYQDFGIRESISDGNSAFYSDAIFYNSGTTDMEIFGMGKQTQSRGHIQEQCTFDPGYQQAAQLTTSIGKLNSGDPLKYNIQSIPKLAFCLPHAHGVSEKSYVSIVNITGNAPTEEDASSPVFGSRMEYTLTTDTKKFAKVSLDFPRYSSSLLTSNVVDYQSIFIPTIDYRVTFNKDRRGRVKFTGLTGEELTKFNKALLNTMKSVYAYNPDYSTMIVCKGSVKVSDLQPIFTSNIISTEAFLKPDILISDYITLQEYKLTTYMDNLGKHVETNLQFGCNLEHCGSSDGGYLVSQITYKLPKPTTISSDFYMDSSNQILIKQSDGDISQESLSGTINKRALYGFDGSNLIQLNASNYTIDSEGKLTLLNATSRRDELFSNYTLKNITIDENNKRQVTLKFTPNEDYKNVFDIGELILDLKLTNLLDICNFQVFCKDNYIIIGKQSSADSLTVPTILQCDPVLHDKVGNKMDIIGVQYSISGKNLKKSLSEVRKLNFEDLITLSQYSYGEKLSNNNSVNDWQEHSGYNPPIYVNGTPIKQGTRYNWSNLKGSTQIELIGGQHQQFTDQRTVLIKIQLKHFTFRYKKSNEDVKNSIINQTEPVVYQCFGDNHYKVNSWYQDAQLRGTSICLDDLQYDPYSEHRLYIKQNIKSPDNSLGLYVNYRESSSSNYSYDMDTSDQNKLRFYLGPCFTNDNL